MLDEAGWTELPDLRAPTRSTSISSRISCYQGAQIDMLRRGRAAHHRQVRGRCSAACTSWRPSRTSRGTSSPRSRSAKTSARSRTRTSKRSTASLATTPARPSPTISACMTRRSTTAGIWRSSTRRRPGSARRSITSRPRSCSCPFSRAASWSTSCRRCSEIQTYCAQQVDTLWDEVKRFDNPHTYYVDLSQKLWDIKDRLLHEGGKIS